MSSVCSRVKNPGQKEAGRGYSLLCALRATFDVAQLSSPLPCPLPEGEGAQARCSDEACPVSDPAPVLQTDAFYTLKSFDIVGDDNQPQ